MYPKYIKIHHSSPLMYWSTYSYLPKFHTLHLFTDSWWNLPHSSITAYVIFKEVKVKQHIQKGLNEGEYSDLFCTHLCLHSLCLCFVLFYLLHIVSVSRPLRAESVFLHFILISVTLCCKVTTVLDTEKTTNNSTASQGYRSKNKVL